MSFHRVKSCSRCRQFKPLAAFDFSRASQDGRHHRCKQCDRLRDKERLQDGSLARSIKGWQLRNPQAVAAHKVMKQAIRRGELTRCPCIVCGAKKSHGHHEDYSQPLRVVWLCLPHHHKHHRRARLYGRGQTFFDFFNGEGER